MKMIQNFEVQGGPDYGRENLPKLRASMKDMGLDGFLIPHEDEYQNEYLPDCNERLMWATGFTGSAGAAVVLTNKAAMFIDGRYVIQVRSQVDETLFEYQRVEDRGQPNWLKANVKSGGKIGYDPRLHSPSALKSLGEAITLAGGELVSVENNPIDAAWTDRPSEPVTDVRIQPDNLAGESHSSKRKRIGEAISAKTAEAALITSPASIAWLLNIRGGDVMCTPLPLSTAIVKADGYVQLFIKPEKITDPVRTHLGNAVSILSEDALDDAITALAGQKVMADPGTTSAWYFDRLENAHIEVIRAQDPIAIPKACKNPAEINGTTEAHKRDGAVITNFLYWLDTEAQNGAYDEIQAAQVLERLRHETGVLRDLSFETISGAGSNGALCHYRVSKATVNKLSKGDLYLVDSGGQYDDGTTDITRTVPIGTPTEDMIRMNTLVLKGHIALSVVRFPKGTTGSNLDVLARMALWAQGFDYDHGTGHGVGVFLGVHEGPQRISKAPNNVALRPGMIVSNEPGFYKDGAYGIRIENLQYVTEAKDIPGGERPMHGFEYITLAPIHKGLINKDMLSAEELTWFNSYHQRVWKEISPRVDGDVKDWLKEACKAL